jgi:hypothetical protein
MYRPTMYMHNVTWLTIVGILWLESNISWSSRSLKSPSPNSLSLRSKQYISMSNSWVVGPFRGSDVRQNRCQTGTVRILSSRASDTPCRKKDDLLFTSAIIGIRARIIIQVRNEIVLRLVLLESEWHRSLFWFFGVYNLYAGFERVVLTSLSLSHYCGYFTATITL